MTLKGITKTLMAALAMVALGVLCYPQRSHGAGRQRVVYDSFIRNTSPV